MRNFRPALFVAFVALAAAGCATTSVSPDDAAPLPPLARPDRIVVYPFAANTADMRPEARPETGEPTAPPTPEQLAAGRKLGAAVADRLVEDIHAMGLHAEDGSEAVPPREGEIVIEGHFESIDDGSALKRMAIGFGSGKAELHTVVVAFLVTKDGLEKLGGATIDSGGGKGPGLFIPVLVTAATANPIGLAVAGAAKIEGEASGRTTIEGAGKRTADAIAERLKTRFQQENWI